MKTNKNKNIWGKISAPLLLLCVNLFSYILLALHPIFPAYSAIIIVNVLFLPSLAFFMERTGHKDKLLDWWEKLPTKVHKGICIICGFWLGWLSLKALLPAIYKDYEKN